MNTTTTAYPGHSERQAQEKDGGPKRCAIQSIKQQRTAVLRGNILPLISLNAMLDLDKPQEK